MKRPLELYLHIPFCVRKCEYCDFLSGPASDLVRSGYVEQLRQEILCQSAYYQGYEAVTVFLGGGTPSLLKEGEIAALMDTVHRCFSVSPEAEITIEANPGTVTLEKLLFGGTCNITGGYRMLRSNAVERNCSDNWCTPDWKTFTDDTTNGSVNFLSILPESEDSGSLFADPQNNDFTIVVKDGTVFSRGIGDPRWLE